MTFKDCAEFDVDNVFFDLDEHAEEHTIDGKPCRVILEEDDIRRHNSHWEAGSKQNFDTGLYRAYTILYIKVRDYGPKPKHGKQLVMDKETKQQRSFSIKQCEEQAGVYRITMERVRQ